MTRDTSLHFPPPQKSKKKICVCESNRRPQSRFSRKKEGQLFSPKNLKKLGNSCNDVLTAYSWADIRGFVAFDEITTNIRIYIQHYFAIGMGVKTYKRDACSVGCDAIQQRTIFFKRMEI